MHPRLREQRLQRAMLSLEGLSYGDAFGEAFFVMPFEEARRAIAQRIVAAGQWPLTDDTMMAISIVETLRECGTVDQERLAHRFADRYDPARGFGPATRDLLLRFRAGHPWSPEAAALFGGRGSFGNGSTMRVAPLGAYFADDLRSVVEQAGLSAAVTHAHREASAGAIAVAVAAALAWQARESPVPFSAEQFLNDITKLTPESRVRDGIEAAVQLSLAVSAEEAGALLGNGSQTSVMDTVPFVLWSAAHFMQHFEEAMWQTASAMGDMDTTCAMVGGIVILCHGVEAIPSSWKEHREALLPLMEVDQSTTTGSSSCSDPTSSA